MNSFRLTFFCIFIGFANLLNARIIYVNLNATGENTGENWANAYTNLSMALANSQMGDSLWVSRGTYYPTDDEDQFISFELPTGVAMFGGFAGTEANFNQHSPSTGKTILDGQLSESANSFTILHLLNPSNQNIVSGFEFINSRGVPYQEEPVPSQLKEYAGGAILIESTDSTNFAKPLIEHCDFINNKFSHGSAIYSAAVHDELSVKIDFCLFLSPDSRGATIGVFHAIKKEQPIEIYNSKFKRGNTTPELSRGWSSFHTGYGNTSSFYLTVKKCTFEDNYGLYSSVFDFYLRNAQEGNITIDSCIFKGNRSSDRATVIGGRLKNIDLYINNSLFEDSDARYRTDHNPNSEFRPHGIISVHRINGRGEFMIRNCKFINNRSGFGGALDIGADATISNCVFQNNIGIEAGGAVHIEQSYTDSVTFNNCTFLNNWSAKKGSFIQSTEESDSTRTHLQFNNCIIQHDSTYLGNLKGFDVAFNHSILSMPLSDNLFSEEDATNTDYSIFYDEATLGNTTVAFVDTFNNNLRLTNCSIGVDAGSDAFIITTTDLAGNERQLGNAIDIGAYETVGLSIDTQITPVSCGGNNNGQVVFDIQNANGNPTIAYQSTVTTQTTIDGLTAGTHEFTIRDTTSCFKNITVEIPNGNLTYSVSKGSISCPEGKNGALSIEPTNGIMPYSFRWDTGDTTNYLDNLVAGVYEVTITDANNCQRQFKDTLIAPLTMDVQGEITNATTNGSFDGSIQLTQITGGTPPYQVIWNTGSTDSLITDLSATNYVVTIIDANNCSYREGFTVSFTTDTESVLASSTITISPNPVSDVIKIEIPKKMGNYRIEIYNANGQIVSNTTDQGEINVTSFPSGVYYLKVITAKNTVTKSFIKK